MSRPHFEDELGLRTGGEDSVLYAHLNLAWTRLGDLVTDSVCPKQQLETQPQQMPKLTYYTFAQGTHPHRDAYGIYKAGEVTKTLAVASWRDSETQRLTSSVPNERRYAYVHRFVWAEKGGMRTYQTTYGYLGRCASLAYTAAATGMERVGTVSEHMADTVHEVLESRQHADAVRAVTALRAGGASRAYQATSELPTYNWVHATLEPSVSGLDFAYNPAGKKMSLEAVANAMQAFSRQQRTQLTHFDFSYVPYVERLMAGMVHISR